MDMNNRIDAANLLAELQAVIRSGDPLSRRQLLTHLASLAEIVWRDIDERTPKNAFDRNVDSIIEQEKKRAAVAARERANRIQSVMQRGEDMGLGQNVPRSERELIAGIVVDYVDGKISPEEAMRRIIDSATGVATEKQGNVAKALDEDHYAALRDKAKPPAHLCIAVLGQPCKTCGREHVGNVNEAQAQQTSPPNRGEAA